MIRISYNENDNDNNNYRENVQCDSLKEYDFLVITVIERDIQAFEESIDCFTDFKGLRQGSARSDCFPSQMTERSCEG